MGAKAVQLVCVTQFFSLDHLVEFIRKRAVAGLIVAVASTDVRRPLFASRRGLRVHVDVIVHFGIGGRFLALYLFGVCAVSALDGVRAHLCLFVALSFASILVFAGTVVGLVLIGALFLLRIYLKAERSKNVVSHFTKLCLVSEVLAKVAERRKHIRVDRRSPKVHDPLRRLWRITTGESFACKQPHCFRERCVGALCEVKIASFSASLRQRSI